MSSQISGDLRHPLSRCDRSGPRHSPTRGAQTRAEYNWALLVFLLATFVAALALTPTAEDSVVRLYAIGLLWFAFIVPWIALVARRCHDMNRRGAFGLWLLATGIGFLITEGILMFGDSDPRGSRFD